MFVFSPLFLFLNSRGGRNIQAFGGYILHTCVTRNPDDIIPELSAVTSVRASVDYDRRRKIAPNHTMTHVLNFALRKVLGGNIDQKGSSVTHEKLRYLRTLLVSILLLLYILFMYFYSF